MIVIWVSGNVIIPSIVGPCINSGMIHPWVGSKAWCLIIKIMDVSHPRLRFHFSLKIRWPSLARADHAKDIKFEKK